MATLNLINDLIANLTQNEVTKSESGIDRSIGYSQSDKYSNPSTMTVSDDTFRAQMPKQSHPSHPIAKTITPDAKPSFQTKSLRFEIFKPRLDLNHPVKIVQRQFPCTISFPGCRIQ
eukprot:445992_1